MSVERLHCCVPFCKRTCKHMECDPLNADGWEVICAKHWRAIPPKRRRAYARVHKIWWGKDGRGMTLGEIMAHPKWGRRGVHRAAAEHLWKRLKREAIERAGGIA
jgi:hypothetical protein